MIVWRKGDRIISIEEYIEYLEKCADITKGSDEGDRLSRQHTQLAVWLKELKSLRWLFKDIQDTCEYLYLENIRYRSCLTDDAENARMILGETSELKAENAKLRELVRDVWDAALHPETFGDGSHLLRCMSELGIEVE